MRHFKHSPAAGHPATGRTKLHKPASGLNSNTNTPANSTTSRLVHPKHRFIKKVAGQKAGAKPIVLHQPASLQNIPPTLSPSLVTSPTPVLPANVTGAKSHKYKVVRVIKRKRKPPVVLTPSPLPVQPTTTAAPPTSPEPAVVTSSAPTALLQTTLAPVTSPAPVLITTHKPVAPLRRKLSHHAAGLAKHLPGSLTTSHLPKRPPPATSAPAPLVQLPPPPPVSETPLPVTTPLPALPPTTPQQPVPVAQPAPVPVPPVVAPAEAPTSKPEAAQFGSTSTQKPEIQPSPSISTQSNTTTAPPIVQSTSPLPARVEQLDSGQTIEYLGSPQSVSQSRGLSFQPGGGIIVHRADSSGLQTTTRTFDELADLGTPPPLSREVIEWMARERLARKDATIESRKSLEAMRGDLMQNRQSGLAREMRLAQLRAGFSVRESLNNDFAERLLLSELRRHEGGALARHRMVGWTGLFEPPEAPQRAESI